MPCENPANVEDTDQYKGHQKPDIDAFGPLEGLISYDSRKCDVEQVNDTPNGESESCGGKKSRISIGHFTSGYAIDLTCSCQKIDVNGQ